MRIVKTEDGMPHVIVEVWPDKSEQQKRRLAQAITRDVIDVLNYGEESVSVAFEEIEAADCGEGLSTRHRAQVSPSVQEPPLRDVAC
jgi:phenylpyruvate tautomerase PptA (4-oxalocrotonate tautomerase family)